MNPTAFLLLLLLPIVAANRLILPDTCSFDGATDGTFSVPVVECTLSTPFLIKKQQTIINEGTPRHELQTAPETRRAIVPDDILKTSNLKLTSSKGRCQNKNEGKNSTSECPFIFFFLLFLSIRSILISTNLPIPSSFYPFLFLHLIKTVVVDRSSHLLLNQSLKLNPFYSIKTKRLAKEQEQL